ncbi:unnamed protein product (macronuclear) [Paramecium tetraurelia]|uniref:RING-type E3 ubiquitin transferase n=1 Tax=Paramecium tetraurelia TaxID=5888 RepID=A0E1D3_PARTE|nr:uncharacterized protein GSPATT00022269001 [Paramecium tetraurelia]CAK89100.1 unnamed protein product [Paramecium tetraurelia]|eukprot:XP_001456497.1 hypothetical protein (macronuclear) [Paramecium tetraurelia strain d4-2]
MNNSGQLPQSPQEQLEERIKALSLKYKERIDETQIFKMFISDQDDQFAIWKNAESQVKSVCGADVKSGELTFQCFTCAPDPHHMYCQKCFDPDVHLNHKCIIKHMIGGACDCGDEQTIVPSGFCSKHQGVSKFDKDQELKKISDQLKKNIEIFIKAVCKIYLQLMRRIKSDHDMYNPAILKLYHLSEKWLIVPIKQVIDSEYDLEEYYRIFQQALYLNSILFIMCDWFTESRLCFIILVSQIFQSQLTPESNQTLFEDLMEVQVLLEVLGPQPAQKIESLLFRLYADYQFKQFLQVCYLKKYSSMWLQTKSKVTQYDKQMQDSIIQLSTINNQHIVTAQREVLVKMAQKVKLYIESYKKSTEITTGLHVSEIHEQHTQYVAEKLQEIFLNHKYLQNLNDQIREVLNLIYSHQPIATTSHLSFSIIFKLRYDYSFFYKLGFQQLQHVLGDQYQQFFTSNTSKETIRNFKYDQFTITSYLNIYNSIKAQHLDIQNDHLTIFIQDTYDGFYFLICQGQAVQVVQTGIQKLFASQFSTPEFQENLTKVLLVQSYQILKKKSKGISVDDQLNEAYKKYIENQDLGDAELFDRLAKIYFLLIKSITVVERVFTFLLSQLYCLKNFSSGKEFESYLLDVLEEDKNELKKIFYEVLSKCLQMYVTVQFCDNQYLQQIYLGLNDQQEIGASESYDSSFLRIYLFLFENEGFQDLIQIMNNRRVPKQLGSERILCSLLLRIFSSDLDMYNICSSTLKELPKDLKLSLAKAIQNFYNLSTYLSFTDIEAKLKRMGIQICSNLPDHVLQICEVDHALKQLKLKPDYRVIYEPAIFYINTSINSQIVEKLVEQNKSETEIHLGNGISWDVELFSKNNYRTILYNILKHYCQREYIYQNIELLKTKGFALIQAYQLLYIQIVAANYFVQQEFKSYAPFIINELEQILKVTQRKDDIQRIQVLRAEIVKLITVVQPVVQKQPQDNKVNLQNKKNQFKQKYNKLQNSEFIQNMLESNNVKENKDENDQKVCSSCKLPLSQEASVALMLLIKKPQTSNFSIISKEGLECFKNEKYNLIDLGIATCQHYFHYTCLIERFEQDQQYRRQNAPDWVKIGCPVCKLPCTITLPIQKQFTSMDVESFNQNLQLFVAKNGVENLFENQIVALETLSESYLNIFFDLLISLIHNPSQYIRDQKDIVFNHLLQILNVTNMEPAKNQITEKFQFQTENNFILKILSLIQQYVIVEKDLQRFKLEVITSCRQYNISNEITNQIVLSLDIKDELAQQSSQIQKQIENQEHPNQYAIINQEQLEDQLKSILGLTFEEFYNKYFTKKCFVCGFYNKNQQHGGFSVCLFCSKTFCIYKCQKDKTMGNLNQHANKEHNGISIYVNLRNGYVTLLCSPISIQVNYRNRESEFRLEVIPFRYLKGQRNFTNNHEQFLLSNHQEYRSQVAPIGYGRMALNQYAMILEYQQIWLIIMNISNFFQECVNTVMDTRPIQYQPSMQISEGEILVKGKTFGRWETKKFIIDDEKRVFALRSSNGKTRLKPYFLQEYQIENKEKKKDKITFDLTSKTGGKCLTLGIENEQKANEFINTLQDLCNRVEVKQNVNETIQQNIQDQSQINQHCTIIINYREKSRWMKLIMKFRASLISEKQGIGKKVFQISIAHIRKGQHNLENFKLVFENKLLIYRNEHNHHQFKVFMEFDGDCRDSIIQNLTDYNKINQWNALINAQDSRMIKELHADKSFLICEIRELSNLFIFKREFQYLQHHLKVDNIDFIVQKQIDQKSYTKNYQGSLKYGVWAVQTSENTTKLYYFSEQSMQGLSYPDEDGYLIQQFLKQIINIYQQSSRSQQDLSQIKQNEQNLQVYQQNQNQALTKKQSNKQEDKEEFYDCEEIDAMNDKLFMVEADSNKNNDVQDEVARDVYEQNIRRLTSLPLQVDALDNIQDWVDKKMKLVLSGNYNSHSISVKHQLQPKEYDPTQRQLLTQQEGGHYIFKKDFIREEKSGGLKVINEEKLAAQKAVIKFLLTRIGASLMMGKSITSISMPVSIFEARSNTERVCNSMGFAPIYLEDAAQSSDIYYRIKQCAAFQFGFIFMYLSCEKPFNPILGETFQGFYDNCPIYCEQISHHPPICAIQMYGRKYRIDAQLELIANFNSNSVVGRNVGTVKITFENPHQVVLITLAPGSLNGTTYGDKVMNYLEKQFIIDLKNKIIAEITFNPDKKYCQFFDVEYVNQLDYLCGAICDVTDAAILKYHKEGYRKYKGLDLKSDIKQIRHKIKGIWVNEIKIDNQKLISIYNDFPVKMQLAQYPIPSDANFRMDLLWWKLRDFDQSQQWKEKLEILQREDRKLREQKMKKKK